VSGFPIERFTFVGFPPHKKGRQSFFKELGEIEHAIVLYESTHRIDKTLEALKELGRTLMVGRELTKLHETIYRGTAEEVTKQIAATSSKGEFVIVIAPA
jgi:16S rRNA (cytidine1402-2'-O)-methyltransferase